MLQSKQVLLAMFYDEAVHSSEERTALRRVVQRRGSPGVSHPWVAATANKVLQDATVATGSGEEDRRLACKGRTRR